LGSRTDVALTAVNGTQIVGWSNITGLQEADHRVLAATFGVEAMPRAGGLRLEASLLDGKRLPRSDFKQASITDTEHNRGIGMRVTSSDAKQRFRLDGGLTRTRFANPDDPLLAQGLPLVRVREESRVARYLDASYAFLQDYPTGKGRTTTLSAGFRHERVDPLFGSLGSFVRADLMQNILELNGVVAGIAVQATGTWTHDNLGRLASIMTTRSRTGQLNVTAPLASFGGTSRASAAWPTVTYMLSRTRQAGDAVPLNSGFQESHVPDQMSTNQSIGADWQLAKWRAGYRFNRSFQDNRQIGRATSDLANLTNNLTVGVMPDPHVDITVDVAFEGAENHELARLDVTRRIGVNGTWRPTAKTTVTGLTSITRLHNDIDTARSRKTDFSLELTQAIALSKRPTGKPLAQVFVRFARQTVWLFSAPTSPVDHRRLSTINAGVTFSAF
jgi:hypothetical protein